MKKARRLIILFLTLTSLFSLSMLSVAFAATTQHGVEVTITTDKDAYAAGEAVLVTVSVKNTNSTSIENVKLDVDLPDGITLAEGSTLSKTITSLDAGESLTLTEQKVTTTASSVTTQNQTSTTAAQTQAVTDSTTTSADTSVKTGDLTTILPFVLLAMVSAVSVFYLYKNRKKVKQFGAMILAITMICGLGSHSVSAAVTTIKAEKSITVDGVTKVISATVSFGAEDFARVSVHDPSVVQDKDGKYYVFGSHMASAVSDNLIGWTQLQYDFDSDHYDDYTSEMFDIHSFDEMFEKLGAPLSWVWDPTVWAGDVIYNEAMGKYCYYACSSVWGTPTSVIWYATSDNITGPYEYADCIVYSGFDDMEYEYNVAEVMLESYYDTQLSYEEITQEECDALIASLETMDQTEMVSLAENYMAKSLVESYYSFQLENGLIVQQDYDDFMSSFNAMSTEMMLQTADETFASAILPEYYDEMLFDELITQDEYDVAIAALSTMTVTEKIELVKQLLELEDSSDMTLIGLVFGINNTSTLPATQYNYQFTNIAELLDEGVLSDIRSDWFVTEDYEGQTYSYYNCSIGKYPNAIDPAVFYDADGKLWMTYGSYSGGIYILEMNESTGEPIFPGVDNEATGVDRYFGKLLVSSDAMGTGEGSFVMYDKTSGYYYLYITYGGLAANDGYNIRVFRSKNPDGPYVDAAGTTAGTKLFDNYKFACNEIGYRSGGHSSAFINSEGKMFQVYHTRFDNGGANHEVRVHQMFVNEDGWTVMAPYEYSGETISQTGYDTNQIVGEYQYLNHGSETIFGNSTVALPEKIKLTTDGKITGAVTGTWTATAGTPYVTMVIEGDTYKGVFLKQADESDARNEVMTFTAMSGDNNTCIWGSK